MTIELNGEHEVLLLRLAEQHGLSPTEFVEQTLDEKSWEDDPMERRILQDRIAAADRGEFVSQQEVQKRFLELLQP